MKIESMLTLWCWMLSMGPLQYAPFWEGFNREQICTLKSDGQFQCVSNSVDMKKASKTTRYEMFSILRIDNRGLSTKNVAFKFPAK